MASKNRLQTVLAAYLIEHGQSPEDFAEAAGVSGMTIRRILDGEPGAAGQLGTKIKLARALREDPETLWPRIAVVTKRKVAA